jgi:ketosteroid isomerase-like protein
MLAAPDGASRLPNGYLAELVERTGKSRVELARRIRFAERYPTEEELCHAVTQFGSWHQIVKNLKAEKDADGNIPVEPPPVPEGQFSTFVADPPWRYGNTSTRGAAQNHYDTTSICVNGCRSSRPSSPASGRTIVSIGREEADMAEAREVMDRVTDAVVKGDLEALKGLYAQDAVAETPDQGTITGRDQVGAYMAEYGTAFPDASWEELYKHEAGDTAIDEGFFVGTNTGSMTGPNGETIAATGRRVRIRECDVATVKNGVVTSHRFYYDVQDWLTQLGLAPETPA